MEKLVCPDSSGKEGKSFHEKPFLKKVYKAGSGKSFAEVLKSNHIEQETHEISLSSTPKMLSWLSENLIGKVTNFDTLHKLGRLMEADGCGDIKLWYMGGLHFLVAFDPKDKAECFLNQAKASGSIWFDDLKFWTPTDNPRDRIASLVVSGMPPQACSSEAFHWLLILLV